jgi:hypothetical protein
MSEQSTNSGNRRRAVHADQQIRLRRRAARYSARLTGRINGIDLDVGGRGTLDAYSGRVNGSYELTRFPRTLHPRILNSVMVTGYPSVCEEPPGLSNPFAHGSYSYVRQLDFGSRGKLIYSAQCHDIEDDLESNCLDSYFEINGEVDIPQLTATAPIVETWMPVSEGRIDGCFAISWSGPDAQQISAVAKTEYSLPKGALQPTQALYRLIELQNTCDVMGILEIRQKSRLLPETEIRGLIRSD